MNNSSIKTIKVLHVIDSGGYGGGESYILDLIRHSSQVFHHMVALPCYGPLALQLEKLHCRHAVIDMNRLFYLRSAGGLSRWIRRSKVDIVHSHGYRANIYGRAAAWRTGKPHVCTVHVSLFDYLDTPLWLRGIYLLGERLTSVFTRRFICISRAMAQDMSRLFIRPNKLILIPNGVDCNRFHPRNRAHSNKIKQELGLEPSRPVIGSVGRMVTEKGQIYLVEALSKLQGRFPNLICLFIGEGPQMPILKDAAERLNVSRMCVFAGTRDDMERVYPAMDILILPSLREPFGLSLLEAMASGIPVIGTSAGGPLDFIRSGETGYLVPPRDPGALAEAITVLLKEKDKRNRLADAGCRLVHNRFRVEQMVAGIEAVYRDL